MLQFFYTYFFLQVENINLATNLENYYFYVMLMARKCTPLYTMYKIIFKILKNIKAMDF